jgi:hypothetical protein
MRALGALAETAAVDGAQQGPTALAQGEADVPSF